MTTTIFLKSRQECERGKKLKNVGIHGNGYTVGYKL